MVLFRHAKLFSRRETSEREKRAKAFTTIVEGIHCLRKKRRSASLKLPARLLSAPAFATIIQYTNGLAVDQNFGD